MNLFSILAEVEPTTMKTAVENDVDWVPVDFIWEQISTLSWFHAVLAISFGVVYLLYGWRIFKALAVISFGLIGMFVGMKLGKSMGAGSSEMWGGVVGLILLASLSMPMMKYCICILGAIAGGVLTGAVWHACELPQLFIWAGGAVGVVAGGMISFIVFKIAVMLFTTLGGSTIMMSGILALLHLYQLREMTPELREVGDTFIKGLILDRQWFLPLALLVPTIIGLLLQNKFIKKSSEWEI